MSTGRARSALAPASLLARTNITLAVSAILIALIATTALNYFVIDPIAQRSADDEAALLVLSAQTWAELPPDARPYFELELAENHDLIVTDQPREMRLAEREAFYLELLEERLSERLGDAVRLRESDELLWVDIAMGGHELQIGFSAARRDIQPLYVGIVIIVLGAGIVFLASLSIVRRIARPLVAIARRVETFRGAQDFEPLPEEGPRELASLARNFNTMAEEITVLIANRTTLLAGISHDLRTPLTRMRLALELLPEDVDAELVERFDRNLTAMDELIGDALRFARGTAEEPQLVNLDELLRDIADSFVDPVEYRVAGPASQPVRVAAGALQRVLQNLVVNGLQHGGGSVRIEREGLAIAVVDEGDGIPEADRQKVFQPFYRLDASRSVVTGGSGLGLAIVQQLCDAHGWQVSIETGAEGGTRVVLMLADTK